MRELITLLIVAALLSYSQFGNSKTLVVFNAPGMVLHLTDEPCVERIPLAVALRIMENVNAKGGAQVKPPLRSILNWNDGKAYEGCYLVEPENALVWSMDHTGESLEPMIPLRLFSKPDVI